MMLLLILMFRLPDINESQISNLEIKAIITTIEISIKIDLNQIRTTTEDHNSEQKHFIILIKYHV